jgi:gamma-glutamyl hercynylcysteine S-oxide synthase
MLRPCQRHLRASIVLLLCLLNFSVGYCGGDPSSTGGGAVGMCYFLLITTQTHDPARREKQSRPAVPDIALPTAQPFVERLKSDDPVEEMISQSRYALLLMRQVAGKLSEEQFHLAIDAFQQGMALVPEGDVEVDVGIEFVADDFSEAPADRSLAGCLFHVEPFFLDRFPVTNRQYYEFVAADGYRDMALWDKRIWPAVLDMVDRTGLPGPRSWKNGRYLPGEEDLPVVGIGWCEAAACARWLCKRLPTDAEWVKAASWPVPIDAKTLASRRYPWGDAMDRTRANVWGSGPNCIVAVEEFAEGVSVGGIYQLIGNVWEWIDGDFQDRPGNGRLELPTPMKSIRGGAFDTYFDGQANTQFQSGENPLSRRHNIGFRCAIGMRDVVLVRPSSEAPATCTDRAIAEHEETAT